ncbi:MAG: FAD-dependent oxidoreductase, partial [Verrucomicrobia bacterium]|nr:FAD-dependent oxidoreductase [Verrucomicrobiota bacterium]
MVVIVGAGLSGLICAFELAKAGRPFLLLEKTDRVGGRIGSVYENGFTFDLGFQVLLDNYPAVRTYLDLEALRPCYFEPGALMWDAGKMFVFRRPKSLEDLGSVLQTARDPGIPWPDQARLGLIAAGLLARDDEDLLKEVFETSTQEYLRGFSEESMERFFRPFFGGVLLDNELETSATLFRYYFKKFLTGQTLVPRAGMQAIPDQLASRLPADAVRLRTEVIEIFFSGGQAAAVRLAAGEYVPLDRLVLACPEPVTAKLVGTPVRSAHPAAVIYFRTEQSLYPDKLLVLQTGRNAVVRNLVQITNLSADYAPAGVHLISATVLKTPLSGDDVSTAEAEISRLFSLPRGTLQHVRTIELPYAV